VEKKDDAIKLSCKWLDDLSHADEAMIHACDQAFDKAKHQIARFSQMRANSAQKAPGAKENSKEKPKGDTETKNSPKEVKMPAANGTAAPAKVSTMSIRVDADTIKLSHILSLKQLFEKHRGTTPVAIDFECGSRVLATLQIDTKWGVSPSPQLHQEIQGIPSVKK
jgi:DNA polymerase-3 subunit alpha